MEFVLLQTFLLLLVVGKFATAHFVIDETERDLTSFFTSRDKVTNAGETLETSELIISVKYLVPLGEDRDFVEALKDYRDAIKESETGFKFLALHKTATDNVMYYSYSVWNNRTAAEEHYESHPAKRLRESLADMGVMDTIAAAKQLYYTQQGAAGQRGFQVAQPNEAVHVLTTYFVQPGEVSYFIYKFEEVVSETGKEAGNLEFGLVKLKTDNFKFLSYGVWASPEDYTRHVNSDYVQQQLRFARGHGIVWYVHALTQIFAVTKQ